jgi:LuxR family maltose regulon positive regulatory protein
LSDVGHGDEGLSELGAARAAAASRSGTAEVPATIALLEHRVAMLLGCNDLARTVLSWAEDGLGPVGEVLLLHAWRLARLGRARAASDVLVRLWDGAVPVVLPWTLVEGRVLECRLALHDGRRPQARREGSAGPRRPAG